jgi:glycosyltransferase involved in cell wall biosynthesis
MVTHSPCASIVIPCFNQAGTLVRAVRSAQQQSQLAEIIIVDDHSTDTSFDIARQLVTADSRIKAVQTTSNMGPGGARNTGVRCASGSHVCFLDADDELLGDFFQDAFDLIASQSEMHIVKGEMEFFDPIKGYILPTFDPRHPSVVLSSSCGMVMPRDIFLRIGGFPENRLFRGPFGGEDVAFMQAVMAHFQPIGRVDRACYRVWSKPGSHLDQFLANTRLTGESFEFVTAHTDQEPNSPLRMALDEYLRQVTVNMAAMHSIDTSQ